MSSISTKAHPIKQKDLWFDSYVFGKKEKMKSCGNFPSFTCWLCLFSKRPWNIHSWQVPMGTEHCYSLVLWSMFSGGLSMFHLGLCSPSASLSSDLSQFSLLPEPADFCVLLALAGCLWELKVLKSHYTKSDGFLDIHFPSLNFHIGIC